MITDLRKPEGCSADALVGSIAESGQDGGYKSRLSRVAAVTKAISTSIVNSVGAVLNLLRVQNGSLGKHRTGSERVERTVLRS